MNQRISNLSEGKLLYTRVSEELCEYIVEHNIRKGDKLPSERELASLLKISRNSVREALRDLENQQIIRVEPGRGSFVIGEPTDRTFVFKMKKHSFFELFEIKTVLEEHIIRELTLTIEDSVLVELERIAIQMNMLVENDIFPQELDDIFHIKLLEEYKNREMSDVIKNILKSFEEYNNSYFDRGLGLITCNNHSILDTVPYHRELIKAMKQRNVERAVMIYRKIVEIDIEVYSMIQENDMELKWKII